MNNGFCNKCKKPVPAAHAQRNGSVYLTKTCDECGVTETLISSNSEVWRRKRAAWGYEEKSDQDCSLDCPSCNQKYDHTPMIVFVDVTNRCNLSCPICVANIRAMGFKFEPPLSYFEKIFARLAKIDPRPSIKLFGGEPTVRKDLVEIIELATKYGLLTNVVTNGLRLADEAYAKELLATGAKMNFSFDGIGEEVYDQFRAKTDCLPEKLKALENIRKYTQRKITLMCVVGKGVNDHLIPKLVDYCHERTDFIGALEFLPLLNTWEPGAVDVPETTIDETEKTVAAALPGVEFVPAGMMNFETLIKHFNSQRSTFGKAHPNCEIVTKLFSDGERFQPLSKYIKQPLLEVFGKLRESDNQIGQRLDKFEKSIMGRLLGAIGLQKPLSKGYFFLSILKVIRQHTDLDELFGPGRKRKIRKILWGLLTGKKLNSLLAEHSRLGESLTMIVLPFEDHKGLESSRLKRCPAAFAYEHPLTKEVRWMSACAWTTHKNNILKATAENYGSAPHSEFEETTPPEEQQVPKVKAAIGQSQ